MLCCEIQGVEERSCIVSKSYVEDRWEDGNGVRICTQVGEIIARLIDVD